VQPDTKETINGLDMLCDNVRKLVVKGAYKESERLVTIAMGNYPHAPEPHNLMGILMEQEGDHVCAMKHFRAAWALDPTYIPARYNMDRIGTFVGEGSCAYNEADCPKMDSRRW
jgi:hypothetical protein